MTSTLPDSTFATRSANRSLRYRAAVFFLLLLPAIIVAFFHRDLPSLGSYHDDGIYLATAKAIAEGKGYRIESLPDERWQSKYPPAFPLALATVWRLSPQFPENTSGFLVVAWLALPTLLLLQMRLFAALNFGLASQTIACLAILAYQGAVLLSVTLLSDLWFCCEVLLIIWLAERASRAGASWKTAAVAGLAAAAAYLTKGGAIVLFASVTSVMVYQRRWRNALVFCAVFAPVIATWSLWSATHLHAVADYNDIFYSSYFQEFTYKSAFAEPLLRLSSRADDFMLQVGSVLIPRFWSGTLLDWLRRLTAIMGIVGIVRMCRSGRAWHYAAFAVGYVGVICIWPSPLFARYVLPVVPLWIAGLLTVFSSFSPAVGQTRRVARLSIWEPAAAGLLACFYLMQCISSIHAAAVWRADRTSLERAYTWIVQRVPAGASVVAFRDPLLYLYTGRHAEGLHSSDVEKAARRCLNIAAFARPRGHRYVLIGPRDPEFDSSLTRLAICKGLQSDLGSRQIYSADEVEIYDVSAGPSGLSR